MPKQLGLFYFEVTILSKGRDGYRIHRTVVDRLTSYCYYYYYFYYSDRLLLRLRPQLTARYIAIGFCAPGVSLMRLPGKLGWVVVEFLL